MPYKDYATQRDYLREYMRAYRRGERRGVKPIKPPSPSKPRVKPVKPVKPTHVEAPKTPLVEPKAIYSIPLTKTHRFEIRARFTRSLAVTEIPNAVLKNRGKGGRIRFAEVQLANSRIELFGKGARMYSTSELKGLDEERIEGMKRALKAVCSARGITLVPEQKWNVGEYSHTTMEDKDLDAVLRPLALKEVGDSDYRLFADDGSHPDKVESSGKENWTGTNLLYRVLFELPLENARQISVFAEQIRLHMTVLEKMSITLDKIQQALERMGQAKP